MTQQKQYLVTRPKLAALLIENGHRYRKVTNPFDAEMLAWEFDLSLDLAEIVDSYYRSIGKTSPKIIQKTLQEHD